MPAALTPAMPMLTAFAIALIATFTIFITAVFSALAFNF